MKRLLVVALFFCVAAGTLAATKPASVPRWGETAGGVTTPNFAVPTSGEMDSGWNNGQTVISSSKMNWLAKLTYDWILYVKDANFVATASSGLPGVQGTGDTNQPGVSGTGSGVAPGISGTGDGAANGRGGVFLGTGSGTGLESQGGSTGVGLVGSGGATGGAGVFGSASGGNSNGVFGSGHGTSAGVEGAGGATGPGVKGTGGATAGDGVVGVGVAGGRGGVFTGQTAGGGVLGTGGSSGIGVTGVGGGGSAAGVSGTGGSTGPGLLAVAGGGGSPTAGALALTGQATPSGASNGQLWYDTTVARNRFAGMVDGALSTTVTAITPNAGMTAGSGLGFWKDPFGVVHLKGTITGTVGGVFNLVTTNPLPANFRPAAGRSFVCPGSTTAFFNVVVSSGGTITADTTASGTDIIFLDGVSYLAEQ